jgi:uncharacterized protein YecE (DUF72 family)
MLTAPATHTRIPCLPRPSQIVIEPSPAAESAAAARVFAGTSGWAYPTWKPDFYPDALPQKRFLEYYSRQMSSVEVNYTFRAMPTAAMLETWLAATPDFFRFSFKAPQRITHIKRLANCEADTAFFASTLEPVRQAGKLGIVLVQLPPNMKADAERLRAFLAAPALRTNGAPPLAFEFRNESWFSDEIYAILRDHNAAICIAESDDFTTPEIHTAATHTSFRLRRTGAYTPLELAEFARRFAALSRERDTYIYFKHEDEPTGALNAKTFLAEITKVVQG